MKAAMNPRYKILFEPVKIGPVTAKNRFYQVPHAMGAGNDMPNTRAAQRGIKAEGGWGVINTGYCSIHPSSDDRPLPFARLWSDQDIDSHVPMVKAVHEHGSLAGIEFFHGGAYAPNRHSRLTAISPSGIQQRASEIETMSLQAPREMSKDDILELRQWHIDATKRALKAGFDIIYCYAGMGFLPYHFLHPQFNKRNDEYGGSLENRSRLLKEIITDMKELVEDRAAIAVRISTDELLSFKSDNHESEAHELFDLIGEVPDLWDIKLSEWTKECPSSRFAESGFMEPYNGFVKQLTSKPVVGVGWFTSPDHMVSQINRGILDFVGSARASIADPFLPNKIFEGNEDDIRECIGCNICASCYNQGIPVRCTQNPTMGEEWRRGWHPERIKKKTSDENILIIGGGPAGLEAAMSLGKRGYEVTLAEKDMELGGRINKEIQLPGMSSYSRVKDYRTHQIDQLESVNVFLDNQMKVEDVIDMEFDHVVIASGSSWELTTIDDKAIPINTNENSNCLTPDDILNGAKVNGPVVIYDFDYYYMGGLIAEFLSGQGHTVNMVTPFENISPWSFMSNELNEIKLRLNEKNVTIHTDSRMLSSNNSSIEIINRFNKDQSSLEASTVVIVGTRKPRDKIYHELIKAKSSKIKSIIKIGDADAPGALYHAVYSGHLFAEYFGEEQQIDNMKHEYPMIQPF